ncbi:copper chaperone PCu(A)C [Blastococcus sp. SYSU D00922]
MKRAGFVATLLLVVLLAGCSALRTGPSSYEHTRFQLDSVDGRIGPLRLLSVSIASPGTRGSFHVAGDSAALLLTIANDGEDEDELIGASSDVADEVVLRDGDDPPDADVAVTVPPGGVAVVRDVAGAHLELTGLQERLRSGLDVPVTFEFRDAGSLTLSVPVGTYTDVRPDRFSPPL